MVKLDNGTFTGLATQNATSAFLGIPFALPPVGDLRMRPPVANEPYSGEYNATAFGAPCTFQNITDVSPDSISPAAAGTWEANVGVAAALLVGDSEDCLTVNVWTPANVTADSKLPILFFLYGGGFQVGGSSGYDGNTIVARSLELGEPVVSVSVNYRVSALGFPGGKEAREAGVGNLGLRDQRAGLRWVQKYIHAFGGDPSKVTIWGGSAGAISVGMQMLTNGGDTEGLFRAAFMSSGGPLPTGSVEHVQDRWDNFATIAGCGDFLGKASVFECLRNASLEDIRAGQDASGSIFGYYGLDVAWLPSADGDFLSALPQELVRKGSVADVPFVTGDCDDEGTLFSLGNSNISTSDELKTYLSQVIFPTANESSIDALLAAYPDDPTQGSPFDTGSNSSITPEFKRISALMGDIVFQAPRRLLLEHRAGKQHAYSYLWKGGKETPILGAAHTNDMTSIYAGGALLDYLIHFAVTLEPGQGGDGLLEWPRYTLEGRNLMTFLDGEEPLVITEDTYRKVAMEVVLEFNKENPI
ncbi:carotenoid ester lipase precursor [Peniophora sp. CONT]|nr:carotenoid ester lipase precursor [Peniophora sp. CONT]